LHSFDWAGYNLGVVSPITTIDRPAGERWVIPWYWLVLGALLLPALSRWWLTDLPGGPDQAVHVYRAVQLDWALTQGEWYPRWSADLVYGFGYPLFSVAGPGAQYLIVALHRLGLSFIDATLTAFALADLIGAGGAFVFGRALFGSRGGALTALAYAYSPYMLMSLQRGALPESLGLALLPWLLWSIWQLHSQPGAANIARTAALFGTLPYIHNPSTALAGGCAVGLIVVLTLTAPRPERVPALLACGGALALGLAVSAWFWMPVVFEVSAIHIERAYSPPVLDYHFHFLSIAELFAWPQPFDKNLIGVLVPRALGWPQIALAFVALAQWRAGDRRVRAVIWAAACAVVMLAALTLPSAVWAWDNVPGLRLIQFPVRLLGPASLMLALLAGRSALPDGAAAVAWRRNLQLPVAAAGLTLFALPWTYVRLDPQVSPNPTLSQIHDWERRTGTIGTTTAGEYLPIWVTELPDPETLRAAYAVGSPVNRLDPASLPADARVLSQEAGYTRQVVVIESPEAFSVVFNVFFYPGWQATVNGAAVELWPTTPTGLISLPVPAGRSTIVLTFGLPPVRQAAAAVSLLGVVGLVALFGAERLRRITSKPKRADPVRPMPWPAVGLGVLGIGLTVLRLVGQTLNTPFTHTRLSDGGVEGLPPLALSFADRLMLIGIEQSTSTIAADHALTVALYWRMPEPTGEDLSVQLTLRDANGDFFGQSDSHNPADFPTSRWTNDLYGRDLHTLTPYPGTPPGTYALMTTVYRRVDGFQLTAPVAIGTVTVTCPSEAPKLEPLKRLDAGFGPITLLGVDWVDPTLDAGATLSFTAHWSTRATPDRDLKAQLWLYDGSGAVAAERTVSPIRADYPTTEWQPGCPLRAPLRIRIPAELQGGHYTVGMVLFDGDTPTPEPAVTLGAIDVREPVRSQAAPVFEHFVGTRFGDVAELVGWSLAGDQVTLVWRSLGANTQDFTVFVHALASDDTIIGQSDSPPAGGTRATTSWVGGEYIVDEHVLALHAESVRLRIGLYEPATGARLSTDTGAEYVIVTP